MKETEKLPVVAVVGPTASGKSRMAVELARRLDGEIISADSMQIYRGMTIGTAKPTEEEMRGIPHYLVDFLGLGETFSVADFVEKADQYIREIIGRGKLPIVVGGTGLYIRSLLHHTKFADNSGSGNGELRKELLRRAEKEGIDSLMEELREIDPEAAEKIHPHNVVRVVRAIEIYRLTGKTMTEQNALSHQEPSPYSACVIGLNFKDREKLYERIERRVDQMIDDGLIQEAKEVLAQDPSKTAWQAIGYKELLPYLEGQESLEEAVGKIKQETRRYAKRQLTWFRRDPEVHWIFLDQVRNFDEAVEEAEQLIRTELDA